ncbi:MAG: hypothetical protein ABSB36_07295 [Candidatus Dormibacteria bacterium]|jgi:hypothetical protein
MSDSDPAGTEGEPPPRRFDRSASGGLADEARHPTQRLRRVLSETRGQGAEQTAGPAPAEEPLEFETLSGGATSAPQARWARRITRRTVVTAVTLAALVGAAAGTLVLSPGRHPSSSTGIAAPPVAAAPIRPSARDDAALAYDPAEHAVILFGGLVLGNTQLSTLSDTWSWDGSRWTELNPPASPPGLSGALLGYDPATKLLVLTGGDTANAEDKLAGTDGTWTWDGSAWSAQPDGHLPASDVPTDLATDEATRQLILVTTRAGCTGVDTWRWGGGAWILLNPVTSPAPGVEDALAFDPRSDSLELFPSAGGCAGVAQAVSASAPVWSWDGSTWSFAASPGKTELTGSWELTTSSTGALVVTSEGTYVWSGGSWGRWSKVSSSPVDGDSSIAYDAADGQVVLFSGICSTCNGSAVPDTWTWAGSWTLRAATTPSAVTPRPRPDPTSSPAVRQTPNPTAM